MTPKFVEKGDIILAGMDFSGNPFTKAGGWSKQNEIGKLWQRFMSFCKKNEGKIKWVSDGGYKVWIDLGEPEPPQKTSTSSLAGMLRVLRIYL